jgi:hypothetical protein
MRLPVSAMLLLVLSAVFSMSEAASASGADRAGSRDPYGIERFPRSWVVEYERDDEVRQRDFVMSRVDRIRRELRVDDQLRIDGTMESVTYQMPDGVSVAEVVQHYRDVLGGDLLFRCDGRACGRSNDWANQIFGLAILYGPDVNQYYAAREWQDRLVGLYVIERGNRRVYAHLQFIEPGESGGMEPNALLIRRLSERGWAVVERVRPDGEGGFSEADRAILTGLADDLRRFADQPIYLVCHLYGTQSTDELLTLSQQCAERGVALIAQGPGSGPPPKVEARGVGPLAPRGPDNAARLELVLPAAVHRQAAQ